MVSQVHFSGSMTIEVKKVLKAIEKNDQAPLTSDRFPSFNGHGPYYQMRFYPSDFGKKNASLYVNVAQSYLQKRSKSTKHSHVEIPAMKVTATLSYASKKTSIANTQSSCGRKIKSKCVETKVKKINSNSDTPSMEGLVASFTQIVSHAELNLPGAEERFIVISVTMSM